MKNKFKKYYSKSYSLHIVNSDKMVDELSKHDIELFPYTLADIQPVPEPLQRRDGRIAEDIPETKKLEMPESYDEWLDRKGLY